MHLNETSGSFSQHFRCIQDKQDGPHNFGGCPFRRAQGAPRRSSTTQLRVGPRPQVNVLYDIAWVLHFTSGQSKATSSKIIPGAHLGFHTSDRRSRDSRSKSPWVAKFQGFSLFGEISPLKKKESARVPLPDVQILTA